MKFTRSAGILLHPTSLPGPYGIGDLGPQARRWIDFLAESGTGLWQILPIGPTGYGDSPYQTFSSFAGNPYLISPDDLLEAGLLHSDDVVDHPQFNPKAVEYGNVIYWKLDLLGRAYNHFLNAGGPDSHPGVSDFYHQHQSWLDDYAIFMALKEFHGWKPWTEWPAGHCLRDQNHLEKFQDEHTYAVQRQKFLQFLFYKQWHALRKYANDQGVRIIGDIPIFIAHDSADAWSHKELFYLDEKGLPTVVAGVPPDFFAKTGQLWGNPLYRWEVHAQSDYSWWLDRLRAAFSMTDMLRFDHFRGFVDYWEVPAGEDTAENGRWVLGPGEKFMNRVDEEFQGVPIIAEDLGSLSPEVFRLRDQFNLPGMKILVFAFNSDESNLFLPHHFPENCVVYTGTHDNDTVVGWFNRIGEEEKTFALEYLGSSGEDIAWDMIELGWSSKAVIAAAPLQDLLSLDDSARMNYPGDPQGNWRWRFSEDDLSDELKDRLREINDKYGRNK